MVVWTYLDRAGEEVGRSRGFADADQAEDWLGGCWSDLLENGVDTVVLFDDQGRHLYRMGLGVQ